MSQSAVVIPYWGIIISLLPMFVVSAILFKWQGTFREPVYATVRMTVQLLLIGLFLNYLFSAENQPLTLSLLLFMIVAASWISLNAIKAHRRQLISVVLISVFVGGTSCLLLITLGVLQLEPWYKARYVIPMAGMIYANAMNGVSLCAERFLSEWRHRPDFEKARNHSYRAALIPITNTMFAAGLVSLPGMMTGQILAGMSPLIAVRYQIVIMAGILGSIGITCAIFLLLVRYSRMQWLHSLQNQNEIVKPETA